MKIRFLPDWSTWSRSTYGEDWYVDLISQGQAVHPVQILWACNSLYLYSCWQVRIMKGNFGTLKYRLSKWITQVSPFSCTLKVPTNIWSWAMIDFNVAIIKVWKCCVGGYHMLQSWVKSGETLEETLLMWRRNTFEFRWLRTIAVHTLRVAGMNTNSLALDSYWTGFFLTNWLQWVTRLSYFFESHSLGLKTTHARVESLKTV